jgi:hypothetical protein
MSSHFIGRVLLLVAVLSLFGCGISVAPGGTGGDCASADCPPPARSANAAHAFQSSLFTFQYFDPWQISSQDSNGAQVSAATQYGDLTVALTSTQVPAGTSAQSLLASAVQNLDTSQLSGLQEQGPIYGAAIGYIGGAGTEYTAVSGQPGAPSVPVYLQIMASVRGTTGIVFIAASTLNPSGPDPADPRQVPNGEYDRMVNSVVWR